MNTRARLCVELGPVKPRWEAWCARHGVTTGEGIRQLVYRSLDQDEGLPDMHLEPDLRWVPVDGPRGRIEIRLTTEELAAARQRAFAAGLTINRWIVAVIRAQLVREPQLGEREMQLLADSNQRLVTIVTLLGRLQRHGDLRDATGMMEGVRVVLDAHLRTVAHLLRANLDRWSR